MGTDWCLENFPISFCRCATHPRMQIESLSFPSTCRTVRHRVKMPRKVMVIWNPTCTVKFQGRYEDVFDKMILVAFLHMATFVSIRVVLNALITFHLEGWHLGYPRASSEKYGPLVCCFGPIHAIPWKNHLNAAGENWGIVTGRFLEKGIHLNQVTGRFFEPNDLLPGQETV